MSDDEPTRKEVEKIEKRDMIAEANQAAARIETANLKMAANISKMETMMVEKTLAGNAEVTPPEKKEESAAEYAARVIKNE